MDEHLTRLRNEARDRANRGLKQTEVYLDEAGYAMDKRAGLTDERIIMELTRKLLNNAQRNIPAKLKGGIGR